MKTPKGFCEGKNYIHLYLFPLPQLIPFTHRQKKLLGVKRNGQTFGWPFCEERNLFQNSFVQSFGVLSSPRKATVVHCCHPSFTAINNFIKATKITGKRHSVLELLTVLSCKSLLPISFSLLYATCPNCTWSYGLKRIQSLQRIEVN